MKNITKIYGATTNETINGMFNNCTLMHPTLTDKQVMYISSNSNFIRVGKKESWKDFNNWEDAAEYANNMTGEFFVGIRPYKKVAANIMATIKNI